MALTDQEQKTLDFCKQVRTAEQVSNHLGVIINNAYKPLRSLQRLGLVEKQSQQPNMKASYLATDLGGRSVGEHLQKVVASSDSYIRYTGVQAHNPFNL